ncbi:hypothetical protein BofuT4_P135350.1 [Botrytis cinerea T4]|uniref:Uncharacterized protein n=1 Tax=Botryotinia fuckeliana (strain T4) TaxID=999810 RepID=G2YPE2_BOTF4|nr:hypothetical protein BofuT4_P135350.1 [Botrytis cinerea T4]
MEKPIPDSRLESALYGKQHCSANRRNATLRKAFMVGRPIADSFGGTPQTSQI